MTRRSIRRASTTVKARTHTKKSKPPITTATVVLLTDTTTPDAGPQTSTATSTTTALQSPPATTAAVATTAVATTLAPLPTAAVAPTVAPLPTPRALTPSAYLEAALDRIERASYQVQNRLVDFGLLKANARLKTSTAATVAETYPAIREALTALGDRHSSLADPEAAKRLTQGKSTGFGFDRFRGGILFPYPGSPAAVAGMRDRDRIVAVNGRSAEGPNTAENALDTLLFSVIHYGETTPVDISVTRATYDSARMPTSSRSGRIAVLDLPGTRGDLAKTTAYIQAGVDATQAVNLVDNCGWVLDLRRNSGGFPYPMFAAIAPLVGEGHFLSQARTDRVDPWVIQGGRVTIAGVPQTETGNPTVLRQPNQPLAILLSSATASAGEAAALAMVGRPATRTFGEATVGLTSTNAAYLLSDGALMQVTTSYDVDRNGLIHNGPLLPDQQIPIDWADLATPADPVLNAALEWLNDQPACHGAPLQ